MRHDGGTWGAPLAHRVEFLCVTWAEMPDLAGLPSSDLAEPIQQLTEQMKAAAAELQFEVAARLRDEVSELKKELRQTMEATR